MFSRILSDKSTEELACSYDPSDTENPDDFSSYSKNSSMGRRRSLFDETPRQMHALMYKAELVARRELECLQDINDIILCSQNANPKFGVTGLILFCKEEDSYKCTQYIEGSTESIDRLFQNIRNDSRVKKVEVIFHKDLTNRMFSEWSMRVCTYSEFHDIYSHLGKRLKIVDNDLTSPIFE